MFSRRVFLWGVFAVALGAAGAVHFGRIQPGNLGLVVPETASATDNSFQPGVPQLETLRFAIIGDFGLEGQAAADVANMIDTWSPAFVLSLGDTNYPVGGANTIDRHIGQYYADYLGDYKGRHGAGSPVNRFFSVLGNHDWDTPNAEPYLEYLSLPGNERYYSFREAGVEFFALDSDPREPDGVTGDSTQARWLRDAMRRSTACWKVVFFHHPAYSTGYHGDSKWMQWPFKEWGADVVLSGHDHDYERLSVDGLTYIVNGLGGNPVIYPFPRHNENSLVRYNANFGAQMAEVRGGAFQMTFVSRSGREIDHVKLEKSCPS